HRKICFVRVIIEEIEKECFIYVNPQCGELVGVGQMVFAMTRLLCGSFAPCFVDCTFGKRFLLPCAAKIVFFVA
ncbi:MAG: hypothetical protein RR284_07575, partial [Ruthenibacterium sp.]